MSSGRIKRGPEGTHRVATILPIRRGLVDAVLGVPVARQRVDIRPAAGASTKSSPKAVKHSDAIVLEVRRLYEQAGMTQGNIRDLLLLKGVDITLGDVNRYVEYQTRGVLIPDAGAPPYI